jgi:pimeloyl-ACP methyl ester carboxylesterase
MPIARLGDAEIYFEAYGAGFPVLVFAAGGLRSELAFWRHSPSNPAAKPPWMDPMTDLAPRFRVVAMDQRNAGRSRAPIASSDDWETYARDHLRLMDYLAIDRCHVMGGCIGASFCLKLCEMAPDRIAAAVLQNPIGHADNREVFANLSALWAKGIREKRPEIEQATLDAFTRRMFGGDFVFSVTRDFVRRCPTPLLVMPGDDAPHPAAIAEEIAALAPDVEVLQEWKGPAHRDAAITRVSQFLERHTPH